MKMPSIQKVAKIKAKSVKDQVIAVSLRTVKSIYDRLGGNDKVAKGTELVAKVKAAL